MVCFILNTLSNTCNRDEIKMLFHCVFIWFYFPFICTKIRISSDSSVSVGEHYPLFKLIAVQSAVTSEFSCLFLSSLVTLTQNPWSDKLTFLHVATFVYLLHFVYKYFYYQIGALCTCSFLYLQWVVFVYLLSYELFIIW